MKFDMTVPCPTCPFRKVGGINLHRDRIKEIGGMMLDSQGGVFPCHKTVDYDREPDDEDDEGEYRHSGPNEVHCAGALIFAEKHETATQMMRIMERCGGYDHHKFTDAAKALVWDSLKQWLTGGADKVRKTNKGV